MGRRGGAWSRPVEGTADCVDGSWVGSFMTDINLGIYTAHLEIEAHHQRQVPTGLDQASFVFEGRCTGRVHPEGGLNMRDLGFAQRGSTGITPAGSLGRFAVHSEPGETMDG